MVTLNAHEALFRCNHLRCSTTMPVALCLPLPFSTMLVRTTRWLSMHLHTLVHMSMLECHPCFNKMKPWTSDPNLHLSPVDTTFCLLFLLFAFLFVCLLSGFFAYHAYLVYPLMPFHMLFASFPSIACMLVSCLSLCMYTHGVRTLGARA